MIDEKLKHIRRHYSQIIRQESEAAELAYYQKKFPRIDLWNIQRDRGYTVNDITLEWTVDQYSNANFVWSDKPCVYLVTVFSDMLKRYEELAERSYKYRVTQGLYISLSRDFIWSVSEMRELLMQSDNLPVERGQRENYGFRAWMFSDSYRRGGFISRLIELNPEFKGLK